MILEYGTVGTTYEGKPIRRLYFDGRVEVTSPGYDPFFGWYFKYLSYYHKSLLDYNSNSGDFEYFLERLLSKCEEKRVAISPEARQYIDYRFELREKKEAERKAALEAAKERRLEQERMLNPDYRVAHTDCPGDCSQCYFCDTGYGTTTKYCRYLNDVYKKQGYEGEAPCDWYGRPIRAYIVTYEAMVENGRPQECPYLRRGSAV